jgi:hypothetical protein
LSPLAKTTDQFFKAITNSKAPNGLVLTGSLIISYFAKSITNAANLGLEFGILGGWHMQVTIYLCGMEF